MRYLTLAEVLELHQRLLDQTGGASGIRDLGSIESAIAQLQLTFDGKELYPTLEEKAAAICFSLVMNHPFVDGNKRIGHAAMEAFLVLNGFELDADVDDAEQTILSLAAGEVAREDFVNWVISHTVPLPNNE